jgi:hypothetical protein
MSTRASAWFRPLSIALLAALASPSRAQSAIEGWYLSGDSPAKYELKRAAAARHGGEFGASLSSTSAGPEDFGTVMQVVRAAPYRGKRVRLTGWVRTEGARSAQMWLRIDGVAESLAMDNMDGRAVTGTTGWSRQAIVLQVPTEAEVLAFGVFLIGAGSLAVDDFELASAEPDAQTTQLYGPAELNNPPQRAPRFINPAPLNMGFEDPKPTR